MIVSCKHPMIAPPRSATKTKLPFWAAMSSKACQYAAGSGSVLVSRVAPSGSSANSATIAGTSSRRERRMITATS